MNLGKKYESQEGCRYDVMREMPPSNQQSRLPSLADADTLSLAGAENCNVVTGCSLNIVFFRRFLNIYCGLWPLSVSPQCQCVYTMAGQTPALQQNSSENSQHFKEKHNI